MLYDAATNQPVDQVVYAHPSALNRQEAFLSDLHEQLRQQEIAVEMIHPESAAGQYELVLEYCPGNPVQMADHVTLARETIRAVARAHNCKAIFLAKTNAMAAGNGCHVHMSFADATTGQNLFGTTDQSSSAKNDAQGISQAGQAFVEGILQHLPALLALTVPTANSFRRIGEGCWTGHQVTWAWDDKEAPLRVVRNFDKHVELKLCDHSANLYLALAAVLAAGLWGMEQELTLRPSRHATAESTNAPLPTSSAETLDALEQDEWLMKQVLPPTLSQAYLAIRRNELANETTLEQELELALQRA